MSLKDELIEEIITPAIQVELQSVEMPKDDSGPQYCIPHVEEHVDFRCIADGIRSFYTRTGGDWSEFKKYVNSI